MRIEIVKKEKLSEEQTSHLRNRTAAHEHRADGPCKDWEPETLTPFIFYLRFRA